MSLGRDVVLAEIDLGHVTARAVRTHTSDELREMLVAGGATVGDEVVEVRWGDAPAGQPVISERPSMIVIDEAYTLVFGLLPGRAVSAEAVAPDGERVSCAVGSGVWLVVVPNNQRGAELYPVLFRDRDGVPINPVLPVDWEREAIGERDVLCPACGANAWDLVTAAWEGIGALRSTRWGYNPAGPGRAFVCRVCGHEEAVGYRVTLA